MIASDKKRIIVSLKRETVELIERLSKEAKMSKSKFVEKVIKEQLEREGILENESKKL